VSMPKCRKSPGGSYTIFVMSYSNASVVGSDNLWHNRLSKVPVLDSGAGFVTVILLPVHRLCL
jgi:hypothetical protein